MENDSLHKSRALCKNELNHTKKISQANYLLRKHYFAQSQRRKQPFIKEWGFLCYVLRIREEKRDKKSKAVKTKTNIILKVSFGEQHGRPGCSPISLIIAQDFTWRQASDPNIQHSNMQVSSMNVRPTELEGKQRRTLGDYKQSKAKQWESNNFMWVCAEITKGRIQVHRKFKLRLWESIWLIRSFSWMLPGWDKPQFLSLLTSNAEEEMEENTTILQRTLHWKKILCTSESWKGSQVTSSRSWAMFSEHWHRICRE